MEKSELETAGYKNLGLTLLNEHKKGIKHGELNGTPQVLCFSDE